MSKIEYIAHRTIVGNYPENSLAGIKAAKANNFDMTEVDVAFTSDGVPILFHTSVGNNSINRIARTSDNQQITETININEVTYDDLLQYDFGVYKGNQFAGTKIAKLEDALNTAKEAGITLCLDFKSNILTTEQMSSVLSLIENTGTKNIVVYNDLGNNDANMKQIYDFNNNARFYFNIYGPNYYIGVEARAKKVGVNSNNVYWNVDMNAIDKTGNTQKNIIEDNNIQNLLAYSVDNENALKQAIELGATAISTDKADWSNI